MKLVCQVSEKDLDLIKIGESLNNKIEATLIFDETSKGQWQLTAIPDDMPLEAEVVTSKNMDYFIVTLFTMESEDSKRIKSIEKVEECILEFFEKG